MFSTFDINSDRNLYWKTCTGSVIFCCSSCHCHCYCCWYGCLFVCVALGKCSRASKFRILCACSSYRVELSYFVNKNSLGYFTFLKLYLVEEKLRIQPFCTFWIVEIVSFVSAPSTAMQYTIIRRKVYARNANNFSFHLSIWCRYFFPLGQSTESSVQFTAHVCTLYTAHVQCTANICKWTWTFP